MLNFSNLQKISVNLKKGSEYFEQFWQKILDNFLVCDGEEMQYSIINEFPYNYENVDFDPEGLLELDNVHFEITLNCLSQVTIRLTGLRDDHKYYFEFTKALEANGFILDDSEHCKIYRRTI